MKKQLVEQNSLLRKFKDELQILEKELKDMRTFNSQAVTGNSTDRQQKETKNEHVIWPFGYCDYHNRRLTELEAIKRKCVFRKRRIGMCFYFRFLDENGNTLEFNKSLFANPRYYKKT